MTKTIPYHPTRGYVTDEQWEKLQRLKDGYEYQALLRTIEKQTKLKGKMG